MKNDQELLEQLLSFRKTLHVIPELGNSEWETAAAIERFLAPTQPDLILSLNGTGRKFVYRCGQAGAPVLAFRADIDALPIQENSTCPYPSQHPGRMHACGHDGHTAVLLALGHIASELRSCGQLQSDVVLLFQPAEETTGGAEAMLREGALENPPVDAVFGLHLMPDVEKGKIALSAGGVMAGNVYLRLTLTGQKTHGATPHLGHDAAAAMAETYLALQNYLSRTVPPTKAAVLTFGRMQAGELRNIVAQTAILEGILRTYDDVLMEELLEGISRVAKHVGAVYGVQAVLETEGHYPPVENDPELVKKVLPLLDAPQAQTPLLTADDFAFFGKTRPAVYAFVGIKDETHNAPLHSDRFDFDIRALLPAVRWYERILSTRFER